jgi:hypothetical protein
MNRAKRLRASGCIATTDELRKIGGIIMKHSTIQQHTILIGTTPHLITVTAVRTENDVNGNPQCLMQVWTTVNSGNVWYPRVKGYRERKDDMYKVSTYSLDQAISTLVERFEHALNN